MVYKDRTLEKVFQPKWNFRRNRTMNRHQFIAWVILLVYRCIAISFALAQIYILHIEEVSKIAPTVLALGVSVYTILGTIYSYFRDTDGSPNLILLLVDVIFCYFLVTSTAGLSSPYLLYSLSPVLTAAFFMDRKVAAGLAFLSIFYILAGHIFNPFFKTIITGPVLRFFFIYLTCVCLAAALPYLTNINLRQRFQSQDVLLERERLSREIHDGSVQTLAALSWQVQLVQRRLSQMGIELAETKRLEALAEKAQQDALTSLNFLREHEQNGDFVSRLKTALAVTGLAVKTEIHLEPQKIALSSYVEHELLRICQEAIVNINKHSGASNARINVKSENGHFQVIIADDGRGFNVDSFRRDQGKFSGHGLSVMQERAESIGGKFSIISQPGQGTEIKLELPTSRKWTLWSR